MQYIYFILSPAHQMLTASPAVSHVLDVISEVSFSTFSTEHVRDVAYVNRWFQTRLRPFLPFVTPAFLSCLATKNFTCQTYQDVYVATKWPPLLTQFLLCPLCDLWNVGLIKICMFDFFEKKSSEMILTILNNKSIISYILTF